VELEHQTQLQEQIQHTLEVVAVEVIVVEPLELVELVVEELEQQDLTLQ
jgi:hypothetical protein|tara:strand:+ start:474 stop:620 length:147 start_codon:yes stop_codon:yes gene_type:complete